MTLTVVERQYIRHFGVTLFSSLLGVVYILLSYNPVFLLFYVGLLMHFSLSFRSKCLYCMDHILGYYTAYAKYNALRCTSKKGTKVHCFIHSTT